MAEKKTNTKSRSRGGGKVGAFLAGATAATAAGAYFLYGPKGAKRRQKINSWTLKAKGDVLSKLENAKNVTEERYHDIVDQTISKYSKTKSVTKEEAEKLAKELKAHWKRIKRDVGSSETEISDSARSRPMSSRRRK